MKILVHSPSDKTTGGPEAIHQLCDALNDNFEAYICYFENSKSNVPEKFKIYDIKTSEFFDDSNTIHIIPETSIKYFNDKIKIGIKVIYWLSVDNYLGLKDYNLIYKMIKYFKSFKNRLSIKKLNNFYHLSQSEYSNIFLKNKNIFYYFIGDYTNQNYLNLKIDHDKKENIVLYNPRKGAPFTKRIMKVSKFKFVPIKNMKNDEIIDLMKRSKIYIDFGRLPGKDRIPREAVLSDNLIIIGKRGSGLNNIDFPIHERFKINVKKSNFENDVNNIIENSINNYHSYLKEFKDFKDQLNNEREQFKVRAKEALNKIIEKSLT